MLELILRAVDDYDFRFDILGHLPIEICSEIVSNLEVSQVCRSRRVSRRWASLLSSNAILEPLLQPWLTSDEALPQDTDDRIAQLSSIVERADAYQRMDPFSISVKPASVKHSTSYGYGDGMLAWIAPGDGSEILLYQLKEGLESTLRTPNRESLRAVGVSSSLLAALTNGAKVYVWRLPLKDETSPRLITLESARQYALVIAKETVAIFTENIHPDGDSVTIPFTIYDGKRDIVRSWSRRQSREDWLGQAFQCLSMDGKSILFVDCTNLLSAEADDFRSIRCDLEGRVIAAENLDPDSQCPNNSPQLLGRNRQTNRLFFSKIGSLSAAETSGHLYGERKRQKWILGCLCSDETGRKMKLRKTQFELPGGTYFNSTAFCLNDICLFHITMTDTMTRAFTCLDGNTGECRVAACNRFLQKYLTERFWVPREGMTMTLVGDGSFITLYMEGTFLIMSFDKYITLSNELPEWKTERATRSKTASNI